VSRIDDRLTPKQAAPRSADVRRWKNRLFLWFCLATASMSIVILVVLLTSLTVKGLPTLTWHFLTHPSSSDPQDAGISAALLGTIWVCAVCGLFAFPMGVGTAIFMEEFQPNNVWLRRLHGFVQINISNLAGVPSVVYGMIGTAAFVYMFLMFGRGEPAFEVGLDSYDQFRSAAPRKFLKVPVDDRSAPRTKIEPGLKALYRGRMVELNVVDHGDPLPSDPKQLATTVYRDTSVSRMYEPRWYYIRLPFGDSVLAGGLTLMLVILPVVIIASQESLRAVPYSLREAAFGLGATRWQVVWKVTLPAAMPGIMTGAILSMSRAMGEAAPMLMIGTMFLSNAPSNLMAKFTVLPLQIYRWTTEHRQEFQPLAASTIIVMLMLLLAFNGVAILIRQKLQKPLS
jgi:phosphate transport system permease protein